MSTIAAPAGERRLFGIGLVLTAYLLLTGIDSSAKWLALGGVSAVQIVFIRYAGHLLLVMAINVPRNGLTLLRTTNLRLQLLRAAMLLGSTIANFIALRYLPLTVTGSIAFTMPLLICALSVPLLGETVGWRRWTAIAIGFVGILIIVRPGTEAFHPAALLSLLASVCAAFYFLLTRRLAGQDSAATQQFYASLFATVVVLPVAIPAWSWPTEPSLWVASVTVALFGFAGHQLLTVASSFAPASVLAPFSYFQIIFLAVLSWVLFNQPPDIWLYLGAPIVIGSGLYIWLRERSLHKATTAVDELAKG